MHLPVPISASDRVLIAGAGGGFDVLCGLPLALALPPGTQFYLANYSFSHLSKVQPAAWISDVVLEVSPQSVLSGHDYFPEVAIARWLEISGFPHSTVYCFPSLGIASLARAYELLIQKLGVSVVFVVDGGVDGIFRGDEYGLGTPAMDSISVIAASRLTGPSSYYVMTGFGSEGVSGEVAHSDALARLSELQASGKFLGVSALTSASSVGSKFVAAVHEIFAALPAKHHSTIVASIVAAARGAYGFTAVNTKTRERPVWLSPLTSLYWFADLRAVASLKLFLSAVQDTDSVEDVVHAIDAVWHAQRSLTRNSIPI